VQDVHEHAQTLPFRVLGRRDPVDQVLPVHCPAGRRHGELGQDRAGAGLLTRRHEDTG
jgi:hypothetical protein